MPKIIFHLPFKINPEQASGTNIRPMKMLQAFKDIGYEVDFIMGDAKTRKQQIKAIKVAIKAGESYDFMYAESSTLPSLLTESHHLPTHPFLDFSFFSFCKKNNIPIGLFYRDIYWAFEEYRKDIVFYKRIPTKWMYIYDLLRYKKLLNKLFLPSLAMGTYVAHVPKEKMVELGPGHDVSSNFPAKNPEEKIKLLYVGGLGDHYQMHELFKAVKNIDFVELTLCTRQKEWEAKKTEYENIGISAKINIVHKTGEDLQALYRAADIALIFVKPLEYWGFASPIKLYEYLGHKKAIISSKGTNAGKFVEENGIGWNIAYDHQAFENLMHELYANKNEISKLSNKIHEVAEKNSWKARALKVKESLILEK